MCPGHSDCYCVDGGIGFANRLLSQFQIVPSAALQEKYRFADLKFCLYSGELSKAMRELIDQSSGFGYFRESNQPHFDVLQIWQDQGTELIAMAHAPILPSLGLSVSFDSQTLHIAPVRDSNLDRILPDLQIEDLRIGKKATENRDFWYPHRSDKEQYVEREDARYVTQQLSPLASYSERHDGIAPKLIAAIIKNEQTYYRVDKDALPDAIIRKTGGFPIDLNRWPCSNAIEQHSKLS